MKSFKFRKEDRKNILGELCLRLQKARKKNKMTQKEVASTRIVSQSELSKIESGKKGVDLITLAELAALYNVYLKDLIPTDLLNLTSKLNN